MRWRPVEREEKRIVEKFLFFPKSLPVSEEDWLWGTENHRLYVWLERVRIKQFWSHKLRCWIDLHFVDLDD